MNDWFDELTDIFKPICFAAFKNKQRPSTFRKQASDFYANKNTLSRYETDEEIFKELDEFGEKFSNADLISSKSNKSVTQEKNSKENRVVKGILKPQTKFKLTNALKTVSFKVDFSSSLD